MRAFKVAALSTILAASGWVSVNWAADGHHGHAKHAAAAEQPLEAGQAAFAAIAEIVALLQADPETDWSMVNLTALREHLVDMNELTLAATVSEEVLADGMAIMVAGEGRTRDAIQRMIPAHAAELDAMAGWSASAEITAEGVSLIVTSPDPAMQAKIIGLGFFGLMATGNHHQRHHIAIARGQPVHQH